MLIFKIIIATLIVGVCALIGINKAREYELREYILREANYMFKTIEGEIKYTLATLPNAIESARVNMNTALKDVMGSVGLELINCNVSYENISKEISKLKSLTPYDKQVLLNAIVELGKTDVEGQSAIINMTCNTLERQLEDSIEEKKKNTKVYKTAGLATGLIIAIVFI